MDTKQIGERIRYFREKLGITKTALATKSGVSPSYIRDLEAGKKCPTVEFLGYICNDGLGISLVKFFSVEQDNLTKDILETLTPEQKDLLNKFLNTL